jgi:hypothetical protein
MIDCTAIAAVRFHNRMSEINTFYIPEPLKDPTLVKSHEKSHEDGSGEGTAMSLEFQWAPNVESKVLSI